MRVQSRCLKILLFKRQNKSQGYIYESSFDCNSSIFIVFVAIFVLMNIFHIQLVQYTAMNAIHGQMQGVRILLTIPLCPEINRH